MDRYISCVVCPATWRAPTSGACCSAPSRSATSPELITERFISGEGQFEYMYGYAHPNADPRMRYPTVSGVAVEAVHPGTAIVAGRCNGRKGVWCCRCAQVSASTQMRWTEVTDTTQRIY